MLRKTLGFLALLFTLTACAQQGAQTGNATQLAQQLTAPEFLAALQQAQTAGAVQLVDVRTPQEFASGALEGAVNLPIGPELERGLSGLDKNQPVFVYCLSGGRSATAANDMRSQGYQVVEMTGGLMAWKRANLPLATGGGATRPGANSATAAGPTGLTMASFQQLLGQHTGKLVLVDMYTTWCVPCKQMAPHLQTLSQEYAGKLVVLKIDAEQNEALTDALNLQVVPTLYLYRDGQKLDERLGGQDEAGLRSWVQTRL